MAPSTSSSTRFAQSSMHSGCPPQSGSTQSTDPSASSSYPSAQPTSNGCTCTACSSIVPTSSGTSRSTPTTTVWLALNATCAFTSYRWHASSAPPHPSVTHTTAAASEPAVSNA